MINTRNILVAAASLLAIASPAFAEDFTVNGRSSPDDAQVVNVGFADLNLASTSGQRALHYRIGSAVQSLCDQPGTRDLGAVMESKRCSTLAWQSASAQIDQAVAFAATPNKGKLAMSSISITTPAR